MSRRLSFDSHQPKHSLVLAVCLPLYSPHVPFILILFPLLSAPLLPQRRCVFAPNEEWTHLENYEAVKGLQIKGTFWSWLKERTRLWMRFIVLPFFIPFMRHGRLSGGILKCNLLLRERVFMARLHVIQRGGRSSITPFTLHELQLGWQQREDAKYIMPVLPWREAPEDKKICFKSSNV